MSEQRDKGRSESGKFNREDRIAKRKSERQDRMKSEYGSDKRWPGARFSVESEIMSTEDDVNYFTVDIRTVLAAGAGYLADGIIKGVEYGHKVGHWDERVAAQQTAFDAYLIALIQILWNFLPMYVMHDFLKSYPLSTTTNLTIAAGTTGTTTVPLFKKSTISDYVADLQNAGVIIPDVFVKLISKLNWVLKMSEEWFQGGITIPASYYYPFVPAHGTTALDALIVTLKANLTKALKFMNFFGIPGKPLDSTMLEYKVKTTFDDDLIAYFGNVGFKVYDGANPQPIVPTGQLNGTDASHKAHRWWFKSGGSPNDSEINDLAKLFWDYHATQNKYGGLFEFTCPTTQGYMTILRCDESEATELIGGSTISGYPQYFLMYDCVWRQTDTLNVSMTGTYLAADVDVAVNPIFHNKGLKFYTGRSLVHVDGILLMWLANNTGFQSVTKGSNKPVR